MKFFKNLAIIGYLSLGTGFVAYVFSDSNKIFGYYDILALIILISILFYLLNFKINDFNNLFKITSYSITFISIVALTGTLWRNINGNQLEKDNKILLVSSFLSIAFGLITYLVYIKPWRRKNKLLIEKKNKLETLTLEGKNDVKKTNEDFIKKLENLYGDKFSYDKVILEEFIGIDQQNNNIKIKYSDQIVLICKEHEMEFKEPIDNVFKSNGCRRCEVNNSFEKAKEKKLKSFEDFKNRISTIYNNKYDFSKTIYKGISKKTNVICPIHGKFEILPSHLLKGRGCPVCNRERNKLAHSGININRNTDTDNFMDNKVLPEVDISRKEFNHLKNLLEKIDRNVMEVRKVGKDTKNIVLKIDENVESLVEIEKIKLKFGSIDEEKCIDEILSHIEKRVEFNDVNLYKDIVLKWFKSWDKLEPLSKKFMPQSEFLYNSIEKSKFTDYSPFILYYCRVLEFELLNKIFIKYHNYLENSFTDKEKLFEYDPIGIKKSTIKDFESGMMKSFKLKVLKNDAKYTLGEMRLILNILPTKSKPQGSERYKALKALQELYYFINDNIGNIESEIIVKIENIIKKYRNPSAHIGTINKESADEFYSIYKTTMNELFDSFH